MGLQKVQAYGKLVSRASFCSPPMDLPSSTRTLTEMSRPRATARLMHWPNLLVNSLISEGVTSEHPSSSSCS